MTRKGIKLSIRRYTFRGCVDVAPVLWPKWYVWRDAAGQWHTEGESGRWRKSWRRKAVA